MSVKVSVVTGGNKGIGFATVRALCKGFDGDVYLTARSEELGKKAIEQLEKEGLHPKMHLLDIRCKESIKKLASFIKETYGGLDVLVNNAAIAYKRDATESVAEQAENTVHVNYFCTLDVCHELFPLLRPHARVVNLSSSEGQLNKVQSKELQAKFLNPELTEEELSTLMSQYVEDAKNGLHRANGWANSTYQMSKVGVTALSFLQQRQFNNDPRPDIVVNAVHPGYVNTDMTSGKGPLTPDQGAEAPAYLALLPPNVKSPRGEYVWCDKSVVPWL